MAIETSSSSPRAEYAGLSNQRAMMSELTTHDPIEIVGDDDFVSQGWPGNGTWSDPYLIEDLNITVSSGYAMRIVNTTRPFMISRCFVRAETSDPRIGAVQLETVSNVCVSNCSIVGEGRGIDAESSSNITVIESFFSSGDYGFYIHDAHNVSVTGSEFSSIGIYGIMLWPVADSRISDNLFVDCLAGVAAYSADDCMITENQFMNLSVGIDLCSGGDNLTVQSNSFINITGSAVLACSHLAGGHLSESSTSAISVYNRVLNNTFATCGTAFRNSFGMAALFANNTVEECEWGVDLSYCEGNQIVNNSIWRSVNYGIDIRDAQHNTIYSNVIANSGIANAYDSGRYNVWDNGAGLGNFWSDYDGTGVYNVPGNDLSHSIDRWPERVGPPFIWIQEEIETTREAGSLTIVWSSYDANPLSYEVMRNGTVIDSGAWNGSSVRYVVNDLELGVYNFTAIVRNANGESSSAYTLVSVVESQHQYSWDPIVAGMGVVTIGVLVMLVIRRRRS